MPPTARNLDCSWLIDLVNDILNESREDGLRSRLSYRNLRELATPISDAMKRERRDNSGEPVLNEDICELDDSGLLEFFRNLGNLWTSNNPGFRTAECRKYVVQPSLLFNDPSDPLLEIYDPPQRIFVHLFHETAEKLRNTEAELEEAKMLNAELCHKLKVINERRAAKLEMDENPWKVICMTLLKNQKEQLERCTEMVAEHLEEVGVEDASERIKNWTI